jgi:hypothetical protein
MSTYKNISDDWYITVDGGLGTVYIDGNLDVAGNITYVSDIAVNDAFIIVAANNTGTVNDMGLVATKVANSSYAGLRFDVTANTWQISSSVYANGAPISAYANIASGGGSSFVAGSDTQIQFNQGGTFGATANLTFDYGNNKLTVQGYQVLGNVGTTPTNVANSVVLYNNAPGTGRTGLYVTGNTIAADEVISLTQARLFSIIF